MNPLYVAAGIIVVALLLYLIVVLLQPERFE